MNEDDLYDQMRICPECKSRDIGYYFKDNEVLRECFKCGLSFDENGVKVE